MARTDRKELLVADRLLAVLSKLIRSESRRVPSPRPGSIRVFCAWCDRFLYEIDGQGETGRSDGICPGCLEEHFPEVAGE